MGFVVKNSKFLAFEVEGNNMEPDYLEGYIIICQKTSPNEIQNYIFKG